MMERELPKGWIQVDLFDLADVITGKKDANYGTEDGEYTFFTCALEPLKSPYYSYEGEVLILPGNGVNVGQVFYFHGRFEAYQRTYIIKDINIVPKFLYYHFKAFWNKRVANEQFGTATNYIKIGNFQSYKVDVPPFAEQERIVAKLDAAFGYLDRLKAKLERIPELLKTFRQAVLTQAVRGRLTKQDKVEWSYVSLNDVAEKVQIGPFGTQLHKHDYISKGIPLINPSHIRNGIVEPDPELTITKEKYDELKNYHLKLGDIVMGRRGEMGRCALIGYRENGYLCGTGSLFIRPNKLINSRFLYWVLSSIEIKRYLESQSQGSTMNNLNLSIVESIEVPLPSLEEQEYIFQIVDILFAKADAIEAQYLFLKEKIDKLPQALLAKAFKGELVEQDENDEPAGALLERIKELKRGVNGGKESRRGKVKEGGQGVMLG